MNEHPAADEVARARVQLRAALESLIHALRANPVDWPAANALALDVRHLSGPARLDEARLHATLDPLMEHLRLHRSFDRVAVATELQALHDGIPRA